MSTMDFPTSATDPTAAPGPLFEPPGVLGGPGEPGDFWAQMTSCGPQTVVVDGTTVGEGSRVRIRPKAHADIFDLAIEGRIGVVRALEQDAEGEIQLAVTLEDDPGADLGEARMPGHLFFYSLAEVEPLGPVPDAGPRILVAGIGNIFLGDDGFGVEVVRRLVQRPVPPGVDVVDFGIRGMDLVYALQRDYAAVVFVDAAPRGERAGTLTLLRADEAWGDGSCLEPHGMDPVKVLRLAGQLGHVPAQVLVLCCEPAMLPAGTPDDDVVVGLSAPVDAAVDEAVRMVKATVRDLRDQVDLSEPPAMDGPAEPTVEAPQSQMEKE